MPANVVRRSHTLRQPTFAGLCAAPLEYPELHAQAALAVVRGAGAASSKCVCCT